MLWNSLYLWGSSLESSNSHQKNVAFCILQLHFSLHHKNHLTQKKTVHTYNLYFHVELGCKDSHAWGYGEDAIEKGVIRQTRVVHYTVSLVQEFHHLSAQKGQHQAGERREKNVLKISIYLSLLVTTLVNLQFCHYLLPAQKTFIFSCIYPIAARHFVESQQFCQEPFQEQLSWNISNVRTYQGENRFLQIFFFFFCKKSKHFNYSHFLASSIG